MKSSSYSPKPTQRSRAVYTIPPPARRPPTTAPETLVIPPTYAAASTPSDTNTPKEVAESWIRW
ncbi:MAG: hypothetical protein M5U14_21645 [Acidimicrobiia bacterium]|nr:hypothetical protein [Acidimicrobiia bacterium]